MSLRTKFNRVAMVVLTSTVVLVTGIELHHEYKGRSHKKEQTASPPKKEEKARVTVHERTRITIEHPDGTVETRVGGTMAWRNNNPGNIVFGSLARRMGAIGDNHGMAVFPDYKTGCEASKALLLTPDYADLTIKEAIHRRSPPTENNTRQLQRLICDMTDLSGKEVICRLPDEDMDSLLEAIQRKEGWEKGKIFLKKLGAGKPQKPKGHHPKK